MLHDRKIFNQEQQNMIELYFIISNKIGLFVDALHKTAQRHLKINAPF